MPDPYPYEDYASTMRTSETRSLLHQMERETIVLLENRNNILPLSKAIGSIALIGPQSDRVSVSLIAHFGNQDLLMLCSSETTSSSTPR